MSCAVHVCLGCRFMYCFLLSKKQRFPFFVSLIFSSQGTEAVEGLALELQRTSGICFNANAFFEMRRLRLLQLDHVQLTGEYGCISKNLRWVSWHGFPRKYIPDNFYQRNIVVFEFKHSNLSLLWKAPQVHVTQDFIFRLIG